MPLNNNDIPASEYSSNEDSSNNNNTQTSSVKRKNGSSSKNLSKPKTDKTVYLEIIYKIYAENPQKDTFTTKDMRDYSKKNSDQYPIIAAQPFNSVNRVLHINPPGLEGMGFVIVVNKECRAHFYQPIFEDAELIKNYLSAQNPELYTNYASLVKSIPEEQKKLSDNILPTHASQKFIIHKSEFIDTLSGIYKYCAKNKSIYFIKSDLFEKQNLYKQSQQKFSKLIKYGFIKPTTQNDCYQVLVETNLLKCILDSSYESYLRAKAVHLADDAMEISSTASNTNSTNENNTQQAETSSAESSPSKIKKKRKLVVAQKKKTKAPKTTSTTSTHTSSTSTGEKDVAMTSEALTSQNPQNFKNTPIYQPARMRLLTFLGIDDMEFKINLTEEQRAKLENEPVSSTDAKEIKIYKITSQEFKKTKQSIIVAYKLEQIKNKNDTSHSQKHSDQKNNSFLNYEFQETTNDLIKNTSRSDKSKITEAKIIFGKSKTSTQKGDFIAAINYLIEAYKICRELEIQNTRNFPTHQNNAIAMLQHLEWNIKLLCDNARETAEFYFFLKGKKKYAAAPVDSLRVIYNEECSENTNSKIIYSEIDKKMHPYLECYASINARIMYELVSNDGLEKYTNYVIEAYHDLLQSRADISSKINRTKKTKAKQSNNNNNNKKIKHNQYNPKFFGENVERLEKECLNIDDNDKIGSDWDSVTKIDASNDNSQPSNSNPVNSTTTVFSP